MPGVAINKLPDEPIVILTVSGSIADLSDSERDHTPLHAILDDLSGSVFFILNLGEAQINLEELLRGTSSAYRGDNPLFKHPNIREIVQVTTNPMLELSADGLDSEAFGNVKIQQFKTLDEALAYARAAQ